VGVPPGGTTSQVLGKTSNADYATSWQTVSGGGSAFDGTVPQNLTFIGTSPRILADMSSAPNSNRLMFQASAANSGSFLGIKPSGTGTGGALIVYEIDDTANSPYGIIWNDGTQVNIGSGASGAGNPKGLSIWSGGEKWKVPTTGHLLAGTDNTYDIGASGATRPRDLFLGRNAVVGGTLTLSADPSLALQAATKQYADTKITQAQGDARYPLKTDLDPYPSYLTQTEGDARYQTPAQATALYLPLAGGTLTGNLLFSTDNTRDIGASGASRPRDLYLGGQIQAAGLQLTGNATIATLITAGTMRFATDNTYDIGVSASTFRPRDLFLGRNLAVGGTVTVPNNAIAGAAIADGGITSAKIATGGVTTTQIADGTIATVDIANAAVTNAKLGADTARANLLTNGGFEVWQRGNGPFTIANPFGSDRWWLSPQGTDTLSVSRDAANTDGGGACAACTFTLGSGAGLTGLYQPLRLNDFGTLAGRTVTLSIRVKTATANAVRAFTQPDGSGGALQSSAFHPGGSVYATLTLTVAISANATYLNIGVLFAASCTAYIDNAMLVVGSQAADYAPLYPADDLARCQRYYETNYSASGQHLVMAQATGTAAAAGPFRFRVTKAVSPTITLNGLIALQAVGGNAGGTFTSAGITVDGCVINAGAATGLVAGNAVALYNNGGGTIIVEANP